jgi:hypothetical protein
MTARLLRGQEYLRLSQSCLPYLRAAARSTSNRYRILFYFDASPPGDLPMLGTPELSSLAQGFLFVS